MKLSTWNCSLSFQYCIFVCVCARVYFPLFVSKRMHAPNAMEVVFRVWTWNYQFHMHIFILLTHKYRQATTTTTTKYRNTLHFTSWKLFFLCTRFIFFFFFVCSTELHHITMTISKCINVIKCEKLIPVSERRKMIINIVGV